MPERLDMLAKKLSEICMAALLLLSFCCISDAKAQESVSEGLQGEPQTDPQNESEALGEEQAAENATPPQGDGIDEENLPPNFEITPSGRLIKHVKKSEKQLLRINPELGFGGVVGKYRSLGGFAWWQFDGGLGFTLKDDWHLRANLRAFRMAHEHTFLPDPYFPAPLMGATKTFGAWFVQPSIYAYYCLGHYEKYHYFFPMDLFIGAKLGMNFYLKPDGMPVSKSHNEINYGIAFLWRWYFHQRIGAAPYAELSTVDYMRNWFVSYGISAFWDFDIIPYREPLGKDDAPKTEEIPSASDDNPDPDLEKTE